MDFILEQQAKFSAGIQVLQETQHAAAVAAEKRAAEADKRVGALERGFVSLFNFINDTAKLQRENAEQIAVMREAQKEAGERMKETDERLNSLILVVERSISERSNGSARGAASKKSGAKKTAAKKRSSRK